MARAQVEVVAVDDVRSVDGQSMLREVASLWMTQRVDQGMSPEAATRAAADGRLREALGRADVRAWVARVDGTAVGYAITSENPFGLSTQPEVAIDQIFVDRRARRHGVARALLTTVVAHAERRGSEVIVSNVPAQSREANRFFARWGFSSVVVRRVVSTSVLRRRLTPGARPPFAFPGAWLYARNGTDAILHVVAGSAAERLVPGVIDHMAFTGQGLRTALNRLEADGVPYDLRQLPGGGVWQLFFHDPNGARVELDFDGSESR